MEEGGGGSGRRRLSLLEQMSALDRNSRDLAGLTLEAVIASQKQPITAVEHPPAQVNRTLLDVIRDEEPHGGSLFGHKDKKSWKALRDRLRLKRAGAAWTSSVPIPASDIPIQNYNSFSSNSFHNHRSLMSRRSSVRFTTVPSINSSQSTQADDSFDQSAVSSSRPQMSRRSSSRFGSTNLTPSDTSRSNDSSLNIHAVGDEPSVRGFRPQMSRHASSRHLVSNQIIDSEADPAREVTRPLAVALAEERQLSAREAIAAQEAAEAEAAVQAAAAAQQQELEEANSQANAEEAAAEPQPVRMSLMDLLEETDRQMGFVGSRYRMGDDEECNDEEEEEEEDGSDGCDGIEHTCCVCMVRHKGAAFIPCGHTFCRLCSRELWVQRGNCPLCNGFILEILDIF